MSTDTAVMTQLPAAGSWQIDPAHSSLTFSARHLGLSKVRGRFDIFGGTLEFGEDPTGTQVNVEIDAGSITTGQEQRDQHLRSADFLHVDEHPQLRFVSTAIEPKGSDWLLHGDLTIRGTTRPVTLDVTYIGVADDPMSGGTRAAFEAGTSIDRREFGLTWSAPLETGQILVGNKIDIELEVVATSQPMESSEEVLADASS